MADKGSESRRKYYAEWRAKNRDKVREYNARYWAKRPKREEKNACKGKEGRENE